MDTVVGPSLARSKRKFVERYGSEQFLLGLVNLAYEKYKQTPFNGVPFAIRDELRELWKTRKE